MLYYLYFTDSYVGKTALTPTFTKMASDTVGTDKLITITGSSDISFVNSNPDTITDAGSGFVTAGFVAGQKIRVSGTSNNNGVFTIATVVAGTITLIGGDSLTAEADTSAVITAPAIEEINSTTAPGWYKYSILFGTKPWDTITEGLVCNIDGGSGITAAVERYKGVHHSLADFDPVKESFKGIQTKSTGDTVYYDQDGSTAIFKADMTNGSTTITRAPAAGA